MAKRSLYVEIGRRVADVRRSLGMSQAQLAVAVGTTQAVVSQIERGVGVPSLARVEAIANALQVPIADLFMFDAKASSKPQADATVARFTALVRKLSPADAEVVLKTAEALARKKPST